jgi:hypothetical protein
VQGLEAVIHDDSFQVDATGAAVVTFAGTMVLVICDLWVLNMLVSMLHRWSAHHRYRLKTVGFGVRVLQPKIILSR